MKRKSWILLTVGLIFILIPTAISVEKIIVQVRGDIQVRNLTLDLGFNKTCERGISVFGNISNFGTVNITSIINISIFDNSSNLVNGTEIVPPVLPPNQSFSFFENFFIQNEGSYRLEVKIVYDYTGRGITEKSPTIESNISFDFQRCTCDARSIGYWRKSEGCPESSIWTAEVNNLSQTVFQGAFASINGTEICRALGPCHDNDDRLESTLCRAVTKVVANLLNIVSGKLELNALLAGADDGNGAFDNLNLTSNSTVEEAMNIIEGIILDPDHTSGQLNDANHVADRIYSFYENENENRPFCIFRL